jgi:methylenetetrahydrofolate reductase (NADPH)
MKLIELVPRSLEEIRNQARSLIKEFSFLDGVNIPDVVRLPLRSDHVALALAADGILAVPHIRCIDRPIDETIALVARLKQGGVNQVLIVSGDRPKIEVVTYDVSPVEVISRIKAEVPGVTVYAGVDPYRSNLTTEVAYASKKQKAGVDGFFSQPFFDYRLATFYAELLGDSECFIGVSPVISQPSKAYWETVNQVVFGPEFEFTLEYNAAFAAKLIRWANEANTNIYLMPIKVDPRAYLLRVAGNLMIK